MGQLIPFSRKLDPDELHRIFADTDKPDPIEMLRQRERERAAIDRDYRLIGYGLLCGYLFVIAVRVAQIGGVL